MLKLLVFLLFVLSVKGCSRAPSIYHSKVDKLKGDNGYQIGINENPEKYVPGKIYTMYLMGSRSYEKLQHFTRFSINVESTNDPNNLSPQSVGNFQLYGDNLSKFNEECVNTISERDSLPKTEIFFMWSAPPPGSGCVTFRAMVLEDQNHWYAEDGKLSRTFCELTEKDIVYDENDCCSCDEAKYSLIFEGIWSNRTHPKDFPFSLWLTHFSDVIGASHERNFSFWGEGQYASEGFRSLAEWGSVRLMETELRAKAKFLRTIIKAAGLWYPNVNANTTASFKVDRRHHLISLASMLGPTPDWVVGISGLNLCLKNCTWIENLVIDLYPYDAGTDSGVTYMSPNAETKPRERIYRITTTYPEDPRAPFYDPSKKEMPPLAKLYVKREKVIPRNCDENFLNSQLDVSENSEDTSRAECAVTEYTNWSECSVTCGKGLRMRTREYRMPQKAQMFQCNRQLVSKEMCVAAIPECAGGENAAVSLEDTEITDNGFDMTTVCNTTPWSPWSSCSETCGVGIKMRTRLFLDRMGSKKCPHITTVEKEKCMGPPCPHTQTEPKDEDCPTSEWSDWSPCSSTCGKGTSMRIRYLLAAQGDCDHIIIKETRECQDIPCGFDRDTAKVVCSLKPEQGFCDSNFTRWYFNPQQNKCDTFSYSGCRGNRNNFWTKEECEDACSILKIVHSAPPPSIYSQNVNSDEPINCVVSEWSPWSACNATCGPGIQERHRYVKTFPRNGGKLCPLRLTRRKRCNGTSC